MPISALCQLRKSTYYAENITLISAPAPHLFIIAAQRDGPGRRLYNLARVHCIVSLRKRNIMSTVPSEPKLRPEEMPPNYMALSIFNYYFCCRVFGWIGRKHSKEVCITLSHTVAKIQSVSIAGIIKGYVGPRADNIQTIVCWVR